MEQGARPPPADESVRSRMARQRRRDTDPEMRLRRRLHGLGYRYRVDAPLPGLPRRRADLLFVKRRVAIFVDGCFWHGCPIHRTDAKHNSVWWREKIDANVERDVETDEHLRVNGWRVLRIWEHERPEDAVQRALEALGPP